MQSIVRRSAAHRSRPVGTAWLAVLLATVVAAGTVGACSADNENLDGVAWESRWRDTAELVPTRADIDEEGEDLCGDFLGEVRDRRTELVPTPYEVLDETVREWFAKTEALGLDCGDDADTLDELLSDIDVLTAEIDAGLAAASGTGDR